MPLPTSERVDVIVTFDLWKYQLISISSLSPRENCYQKWLILNTAIYIITLLIVKSSLNMVWISPPTYPPFSQGFPNISCSQGNNKLCFLWGDSDLDFWPTVKKFPQMFLFLSNVPNNIMSGSVASTEAWKQRHSCYVQNLNHLKYLVVSPIRYFIITWTQLTWSRK